jgi:HAMP domain-containing protein
MVWVNKLSSDFPDFLAKDEGGHAAFYGKNPALATRELSTIANTTSLRATFLVTSDDYRQEANKPDNFENMAISSFKNHPTLTFMDGFEGGIYRYARPILVKQGCLKCHGKPEDAPPAVIEKYGDSKAFGYKVGDVRGIISVKLPTISLKNIIPVLSNPIAIALVVFAFLMNFLFTKFVIIKRLSRLTKDAAAIAKGKLTTKLDYTPPAESNNEIDHAYHSVNLLKKSMDIILKKSNKKK